jgi:hypothetical protein
MKGNGHAKCKVRAKIDEAIEIKAKLNISGEVTGGGSNTQVVKYQLTAIVQKPFMCRDGVDYLHKKGLVEGLFKI